jgi:hypothetical protein
MPTIATIALNKAAPLPDVKKWLTARSATRIQPSVHTAAAATPAYLEKEKGEFTPLGFAEQS